jgi:hypothetical protein
MVPIIIPDFILQCWINGRVMFDASFNISTQDGAVYDDVDTGVDVDVVDDTADRGALDLRFDNVLNRLV